MHALLKRGRQSMVASLQPRVRTCSRQDDVQTGIAVAVERNDKLAAAAVRATPSDAKPYSRRTQSVRCAQARPAARMSYRWPVQGRTYAGTSAGEQPGTLDLGRSAGSAMGCAVATCASDHQAHDRARALVAALPTTQGRGCPYRTSGR